MKTLFVGIYDTNTLPLASYMLAQECEGEVLEFSIFTNTVDEIIEQINKRDPDVVGFSAYV